MYNFNLIVDNFVYIILNWLSNSVKLDYLGYYNDIGKM